MITRVFQRISIMCLLAQEISVLYSQSCEIETPTTSSSSVMKYLLKRQFDSTGQFGPVLCVISVKNLSPTGLRFYPMDKYSGCSAVAEVVEANDAEEAIKAFKRHCRNHLK